MKKFSKSMKKSRKNSKARKVRKLSRKQIAAKARLLAARVKPLAALRELVYGSKWSKAHQSRAARLRQEVLGINRKLAALRAA